jgi:hypothetical protein
LQGNLVAKGRRPKRVVVRFVRYSCASERYLGVARGYER